MSIIIFLIVLSILIVVHEWGHYITAKKMGVKVERFSLGFGPKLFSKMHDGTEFMLCLFPLGGYVKMAGDERDECKGAPDEYYSKSPGQRTLIVLMGPVVNYLLAYLCFVVVFCIGYPAVAPKIGNLIEGYPAAQAGLKAGDQILIIEGQAVQSWEDVQKHVSSSKKEQLEFLVQRGSTELPITVRPRVDVLENIFKQKENVRVVGIRPAEEIVILKFGPGQALIRSADKLKEITYTTYKALYRMVTGAMSPKETMTGPIGIFFIIEKASQLGLAYLLMVMGIISASLAIFNLLPLPVLDGGHIFLFGLEKIRGQALPKKIEEVIARVGFSLIICLAVFVFYSDFDRLGWIDKIFGMLHR